MNRRMIAACACVVLVGSIALGIAIAQQPKSKYEFEMYHVLLVEKGPNWKPYGTDEAMEVQQRMITNLGKLDESGALVAGGLVNDNSPVELIFIFRTLKYNEVMALIQQSPNVQNGFYKVEFYPWFAFKGLKAGPPRSD
jgi:hypothetical protein